MKNSNKNLLGLVSFIVLVIAAFLVFSCELLPICGIELTGKLINILKTIRDIFILLVIGLNAWAFASTKGKATKITFLVAILIFIAGIILVWFQSK